MLRTTEQAELHDVEEQVKLKGHKWQVSCLDFSVNGLLLASGSWDKDIRIWDLSTLETTCILGQGIELEGHLAPVTTVSWLPSTENILATGSADNTACIWNIETGKKLSTLKEHSAWVLGTSFTKNGTHFATASWDQSVIVWDVGTFKALDKLEGHSEGIWKCKFAERTQTLCTASEDTSLRLWDLRSLVNKYQSITTLVGVHDDGIKACAWSHCGNYIAAGSTDATISIWDIRENKVLTVIKGHEDMVSDVAFLAFSGCISYPIIASVGDITCRIWDIFNDNAKQLQCLKQHDRDYEVECLAVSPDGSLFATGGRDNNIVLSTIPDINLETFYHKKTDIPKEQQQIWEEEVFMELNSVSYPGDVADRNKSKRNKSSRDLVDSAKQRTEMLQLQKSKMAAKQTVRVKSSATSNVLQAQLVMLKSTQKDVRNTVLGTADIGPRNVSVSKNNGKLRRTASSVEGNMGRSNYQSKEFETRINRLHSVSNNTFYTSPADNPVFNSMEPEQKELNRQNSQEFINGGLDGVSESYEAYIEDVTQEMIRISDEQQQYVNEDDFDSRL